MLQATQAIENADAPIGIDHYPRDWQTFPIKSLSFLFDKQDLQHPLIVTSVEDIGGAISARQHVALKLQQTSRADKSGVHCWL